MRPLRKSSAETPRGITEPRPKLPAAMPETPWRSRSFAPNSRRFEKPPRAYSGAMPSTKAANAVEPYHAKVSRKPPHQGWKKSPGPIGSQPIDPKPPPKPKPTEANASAKSEEGDVSRRPDRTIGGEDRTRPPGPGPVPKEPAAIVIRRPAPGLIRNPRPALIRLPHPAAVAVRRPASVDLRNPY